MRRWVLVATLVAVSASVSAACTKGEIEPLPPPPSVPQTTSTTAIDFSGIGLGNSVTGRTTTTIAVQPGLANITGTVVGPTGPVPQAVVRAERLVGDGAGSIDVVTGDDGTYALPTVLGGRYRVRAWKQAPDNLSMVEPEVFFLEGRENKVLDLAVRVFQGVGVTNAIAPNPPVLGEPANLVVQVVDRIVDESGIVRGTPVVGVFVELFGAGDWRLRSENPTVTSGEGRATFTIECRRAGDQPLSLVVGETTYPLEVPPCGVPAETGETGETAPTTTAAPAAPTTTAG